MKLAWPATNGTAASYDVEPSVARIAGVLGLDLTVAFLLKFGGGTYYIGTGPSKNRSQGGDFLGKGMWDDLRLALQEDRDNLFYRFPVANRFLARALRARGLSISRIAGKMRARDATIRDYLRADKSCTILNEPWVWPAKSSQTSPEEAI